MEIISINDIEVCSSLIDEMILSKFPKPNNTNNEGQSNNNDNTHLQSLVTISHNIDNNIEVKQKKNDASLKNEIYIMKDKK